MEKKIVPGVDAYIRAKTDEVSEVKNGYIHGYNIVFLEYNF